jgi:hypothetical protein
MLELGYVSLTQMLEIGYVSVTLMPAIGCVPIILLPHFLYTEVTICPGVLETVPATRLIMLQTNFACDFVPLFIYGFIPLS